MYSFTKHRIHVLINIDKPCWKIASGNNQVFWRYMYHTTRPPKLSTSREYGPKDFKYNLVKQFKNYR